jgi:signal transduction histidine kinase
LVIRLRPFSGLIVLMIITMILVNKIVKPIKLMTTNIKKLAQGKFNNKIN